MVRIFLVVVALVGIGFLVQWFIRTEPRKILQSLRWAGLAIVVIVAVILIATRQFQLLYPLAVLLVPWLLRARAVRNRMKSAHGPTPGQTSEVRTRFVVMQLDHDSGEMDGVVQEGPFAGKQLSSLSMEDVISIFRAAAAADQASAQVLQAYLERMHGDAWRSRAGQAGASSGEEAAAAGAGPMGVAEARSILGVDANASDDEIKRAHRRLMKQFHPDHGGSDYLAARINEAKEVLLGDR
jgi:hypothetical protein